MTDTIAPSEFGCHVARLRRERGLNIVDLARLADLDRSMIERIETGVTQNPRARTKKALADAFAMSVADLEAGGKVSASGNASERPPDEG